MRALLVRARSLWRALRHRDQLDAHMHDEMRFHIDMETDRLMREGQLDAVEARRRALVAFGGVTKYHEAGRDTRGVRWLEAISLDTRLGLRMLIKHRGLTLVGGFAMAVAIAIGVAGFEAVGELLRPSLPLDQGDRIVALRLPASPGGSPAARVIDDALWRDELRSIEQLSAFRTTQLNLVTSGALPEPITVAEITASGFSIARTPPHLGRHLLAADEAANAAAVMVLGYEAWTLRFGSDPQVLGRTVQLGGILRTVVGVMPHGFRFPVNHQYWIPLPRERLTDASLRPELHFFGRLARDVTMEQAQVELTTIGNRAAAAAGPEAAPGSAPTPLVVVPYTRDHLDLTDPMLVWLFRMAQLLVGALVAVVAVNLAVLFYARTVTRRGEIAVRTALGASRARILAQLFIEALALAGVATLAGLALADVALAATQSLAQKNGSVPFWLDFQLSPASTAYALGLAVVAALIMGMLPGLKATGRELTGNLHEANSRSGTRIGPVWTALIIAQVAAAVTVLPVAGYLAWQVTALEVAGTGFADHRFVVATMAFSDEMPGQHQVPLRDRQQALKAQLESEPGVAGVTLSSSVPGFSAGRTIELEERRPGAPTVVDVSRVEVAVGFFELYEARVLAGRVFEAADIGAAERVVVNQSLLDALPAGASVLGTRFRYSRSRERIPQTDGAPWYQIVGVVGDFPQFPPALSLDTNPTIYHLAAPGTFDPAVVSIRLAGEIPEQFVARVRAISAAIDPSMQMRRVVPLSDFYHDVRSFWRYLAWGVALVTLSVLLLSAAGIYALMSFTVAQRTREIGIRSALGAHPHRVLASVFARSVRQLLMGVGAGSVLSFVAWAGRAEELATVGLDWAEAMALLAAVAALMITVGVAATYGPARRALRTQAIDALRAET
jgi:putative ABC transport system permease protein